MLLIFASVFSNGTVKVPGGTVNESVYYVPAITTFGLIAACFSNLMVSVVRYREAGIYKRRRATPVAASTIIGGRAVAAVVTGVVITLVLLAIGWAGFGASIPGHTAPAFILFVVIGAVVLCCLGFAVASLITEADALGPKYRVSVTSGSTLKVGRAGVIPAKVQLGSSHGTTTFTVRTTGLIVSRVIQACSINPRIRRALREGTARYCGPLSRI